EVWRDRTAAAESGGGNRRRRGLQQRVETDVVRLQWTGRHNVPTRRRRNGLARLKLRSLSRVADYGNRTASVQAHRDGRGGEGGEQRDVHRPEPPDRHDGDKVGAAFAHERRHTI